MSSSRRRRLLTVGAARDPSMPRLGAPREAPLGGAFDAVFGDLAGDGVPVDPQHFGGLTQAALAPQQGAADEQLLELTARIFVVHALIEHFRDQPLHLLLHAPPRRVRGPTGGETL